MAAQAQACRRSEGTAWLCLDLDLLVEAMMSSKRHASSKMMLLRRARHKDAMSFVLNFCLILGWP
jgi:hypothetical protein